MSDSKTTSKAFDGEKVTIYTTSEFMGNIIKTEAKIHETGRMKYAQYDSAPYVVATPKRKRSKYRFMKTYKPYILVVEGWNQPDPEDHMKVLRTDGNVKVSQSKYSCFDSRYTGDFNSFINVLIEKDEVKVVEDFRNVNSYNRLMDGK